MLTLQSASAVSAGARQWHGNFCSCDASRPSSPKIATVLLVAWCLSCGRSEAQVRLSGTPDRIVLQTNDATIVEILVRVAHVARC